MQYTKNVPDFTAQGTSMSSEKLSAGFAAGEKPPANWFNWLFYSYSQALKELQTYALHSENTVTVAQGGTGATTAAGAITNLGLNTVSHVNTANTGLGYQWAYGSGLTFVEPNGRVSLTGVLAKTTSDVVSDEVAFYVYDDQKVTANVYIPVFCFDGSYNPKGVGYLSLSAGAGAVKVNKVPSGTRAFMMEGVSYFKI